MKPALCSFCELTPGFTAPTVPISQHTKGRRVPCNQHYKEPAMQANQLFAKPTFIVFKMILHSSMMKTVIKLLLNQQKVV